ncbi:hypothetical protein [Burkholderia anthina]|uniref:hypothetical protein n=1 Tax=Burkholderia anthina TaxID=179879 RepID=UPI0037BECC9D
MATMATVTFLMMLFMGGFCALCGAIRYSKKLKEWSLQVKANKQALKKEYTPDDLVDFDLKRRVAISKGEKAVAAMQANPSLDPDEVEIAVRKLAKLKADTPADREWIVNAIAGHFGMPKPNPVSIAVWAGVGAFVAFVFGVIVASA